MNNQNMTHLLEKRRQLEQYVWDQYRIYKQNLLQLSFNNNQILQDIFDEKERRKQIIEQYTKRIEILKIQLNSLQNAKQNFNNTHKETCSNKYDFLDFSKDLEEESKQLDEKASTVFCSFCL